MAVKNAEHREPVEASCVMARAFRLTPVSESFAPVITLATETHLVETLVNLADRHQALVAQDIMNTAPRIHYNIKTANASRLYVPLLNSMEFLKC